MENQQKAEHNHTKLTYYVYNSDKFKNYRSKIKPETYLKK
jgi:hypothetical protein